MLLSLDSFTFKPTADCRLDDVSEKFSQAPAVTLTDFASLLWAFRPTSKESVAYLKSGWRLTPLASLRLSLKCIAVVFPVLSSTSLFKRSLKVLLTLALTCAPTFPSEALALKSLTRSHVL